MDTGQRHFQQARLVGSLVGRGLEKELVLKVGLAWLEHFQGKYATLLKEARLRLVECIRQTLSNPKFRPAKVGTDYRQLHQQASLLSWQLEFLGSTISQSLGSGNKCDPLLVQVEDHTLVEDHTSRTDDPCPDHREVGKGLSRNGKDIETECGTLCPARLGQCGRAAERHRVSRAAITSAEQALGTRDSERR